MPHCVGLRVWSLLFLVLLSGLGEATAEARPLRGRRQRCCCPPACQPCCPEPCYCAPRDLPRICAIDELYDSPGYYVYYAHHHENGEECPEYAGMIYEDDHDHDPVPEACYEDCEVFGSRRKTLAGFPAPIGTNEDLMRYMSSSKATKVDELAGNLLLPDGREIHARVGLFKVKVPLVMNGVEKEVWEYFFFGFEAEDTGKDDFHALEISHHTIGTPPKHVVQKNLIEFKIGATGCVVLTVKQ
jgi:hypothetical protein